MLIFDADCSFCTTTARWVEERLDGRGQVVAYQTVELEPLGLTPSDAQQAAYWIDTDGRIHRGHAAIARALSTTSGAWRTVGWFIKTPPISWIARPVYAVIARHRARIPGGTPA